MNRSRIARRALALAAGSAVAVAASLAFAAPASAHHTTVEGSCAAGSNDTWIVTWKVHNSEDISAKLTLVEYTPEGSQLTGIKKDNTIAAKGFVTGTQVVDKKHQWATLKVAGEWDRGEIKNETPKTGSVNLEKECEAPSTPKPPVPSAPATPEPSAPASPSAPATPEPEPTLPALPGEPKVDIVFTCEEIVFTLDNPKNGVEFELIFTPKGGAAVTKKFPAGEKTVVKFPAKKGTVITVSAKDWDGEKVDIPWEEPEGCDEGDDGGLPVTGTAVGGIAAGAAVLLAIGAGLFIVARRRRIRFTA